MGELACNVHLAGVPLLHHTDGDNEARRQHEQQGLRRPFPVPRRAIVSHSTPSLTVPTLPYILIVPY